MSSCMRTGCDRPKVLPKHLCYWHDLMRMTAEQQREAAQARTPHFIGLHRGRVPEGEWPAGERWCAGCQSFVPLFYTSGSRCKSCASTASHNSRLKGTYGIDREEYEALLAAQGGRCYICQREVHSKRLAVDHDHVTGAVRGLLCPDVERGCNHAVVGSLEASAHGGERGIDLARRLVDYLEDPPYARLCRERGVEPQQLKTAKTVSHVGTGPKVGRAVVAEMKAVPCSAPNFHPGFCGCP